MPILSFARNRLLRTPIAIIATSLAASLALLSASALAAEREYYKVSELLKSESAKEILAAPVTLYWGNQATPEFAELASPDTYSRVSISASPFGGSRRHCIEAFEKALQAMVTDAAKRGYDAIVGIRPLVEGIPAEDADGFHCKPGYKTTKIGLASSFALTQEAAQRAAAEEAVELVGPPRPPSDGAIYLPLGPILSAPEMKAIFGSDVVPYWDQPAPAYSERYGPESYRDTAEIATYGKEGACKEAVIKILLAMADGARDRGYDSVINIRSYLYDQHTPVASDFECEIGRKRALVTLRASLAKKRP